MTIVEFLLARIAEDETRANYYDPLGASIGPARLLAEGQAKRAIVDMHKQTTLEDLWGAARSDIAKTLVCEYDSSPDGHIGDTLEWPCTTLRILAAVYADHLDYNEAWRP